MIWCMISYKSVLQIYNPCFPKEIWVFKNDELYFVTDEDENRLRIWKFLIEYVPYKNSVFYILDFKAI